MAPILGIIRAVDRKILRVRMKNEINLEKKSLKWTTILVRTYKIYKKVPLYTFASY